MDDPGSHSRPVTSPISPGIGLSASGLGTMFGTAPWSIGETILSLTTERLGLEAMSTISALAPTGLIQSVSTAINASQARSTWPPTDQWFPTNMIAFGPEMGGGVSVIRAMFESQKDVLASMTPQIFAGGFIERVAATAGVGIHLEEYSSAVRSLFSDLDLVELDEYVAPFVPSSDDTAYEFLARSAPAVAAAIDQAAASVSTPFWSRRVIRNALATLVSALFVALFVTSKMVLPPPWNDIVGDPSLVAVPGSFRLIKRLEPRDSRRR